MRAGAVIQEEGDKDFCAPVRALKFNLSSKGAQALNASC